MTHARHFDFRSTTTFRHHFNSQLRPLISNHPHLRLTATICATKQTSVPRNGVFDLETSRYPDRLPVQHTWICLSAPAKPVKSRKSRPEAFTPRLARRQHTSIEARTARIFFEACIRCPIRMQTFLAEHSGEKRGQKSVRGESPMPGSGQ